MTPCKYIRIEYYSDEPDFTVAETGTFVCYQQDESGLKALVLDKNGKHILTFVTLVQLIGVSVEDTLKQFVKELEGICDDYIAPAQKINFLRDVNSIIQGIK